MLPKNAKTKLSLDKAETSDTGDRHPPGSTTLETATPPALDLDLALALDLAQGLDLALALDLDLALVLAHGASEAALAPSPGSGPGPRSQRDRPGPPRLSCALAHGASEAALALSPGPGSGPRSQRYRPGPSAWSWLWPTEPARPPCPPRLALAVTHGASEAALALALALAHGASEIGLAPPRLAPRSQRDRPGSPAWPWLWPAEPRPNKEPAGSAPPPAWPWPWPAASEIHPGPPACVRVACVILI